MTSQIREALDAILKVNFREAAPSDTARLGTFLERAAEEVQTRLEQIERREQEVSAREAATSLRENEISDQIKALGSVKRVRSALEHGAAKRVGWWR